MQPATINLAKIRKTLVQSLITSMDEEPNPPGISWDVITQLQASEEELQNALFKINAVELEGLFWLLVPILTLFSVLAAHWWLMAPELVVEVTDLLLTEGMCHLLARETVLL